MTTLYTGKGSAYARLAVYWLGVASEWERIGFGEWELGVERCLRRHRRCLEIAKGKL